MTHPGHLSHARDLLAEALHARACEFLQDYVGFNPFAATTDRINIEGVSDYRNEGDLDDKERIAYLVGLIERRALDLACVAGAVCFQTDGTPGDSDEVETSIAVLAFSQDGEVDWYSGSYRNAMNNPEFDPLVKMEFTTGIMWDVPTVGFWTPVRHATQREDRDKLIGFLLEFAERRLKEYGELHVFAASIGDDGAPTPVEFLTEPQDLSSQGQIATATRVLSSKASLGEIRAFGICFDSVHRPPDDEPSDAVQLLIEHRDGMSIECFWRYSKGRSGVFEFGEIFQEDRPRTVFEPQH